MNQSWSDDFEVLHWVVERFGSSGHSVEVGEALRVFPEENYDGVRESLRRLSSHTYVVAVNGAGMRPGIRGGPSMVNGGAGVNGGARSALRLVDDLPDNAESLADRILAVLVEGVVNEPDLEKRFKLEAGLKGLGGMTRDMLVEVVAAAITRSSGVSRSWSGPYDAFAQDQTCSPAPG